jgi:hypothetical protein
MMGRFAHSDIILNLPSSLAANELYSAIDAKIWKP